MSKFYFTFLLVLVAAHAFAQKYKVAGLVKDENGKGIPGVIIQEMGTNAKGITNDQGVYQMYVHYGNATLIVDFEGFDKVKREIHGIGTQNFILKSIGKTKPATIVGSRNLKTRSEDLTSPVEIIDVKKIASLNGQFDLTQLLQFVSTSLNSNRQIGADGTDNIDQVSIHGMGPDQMLLLVNGKRRHQSALINLSGSYGRGNSSADLNTIPVAAIDRIEILKDGAAAQYGSDAVAGVVNIILKETTNGFSANANAGIRKAKYNRDSSFVDGLNYNANLNYGAVIGRKGFINVTADYNFRNHTNRSNTQPDSIVRKQFGDPRVYNGSITFNASLPINENLEIYSFGGYNYRQTESFAFSRTLLKKDSLYKIYPNGFDPVISRNIEDRAATVGVRTKWNGFNVDVSNTYGFNKFHYKVNHSLNESFGKGTPTSMDAGGFKTNQNVTNLNLSQFYDDILQGVNLAFGAEYRMDWYNIFSGDYFSYRTYDPLKPTGARGFRGYSPAEEISKKRYNAAGYVDVEAKISKRLSVSAAGRYDYYNDLGSAVSGKGGLRFNITNELTLCGSYGIGFRAPSLAQQYFSNATVNPTTAPLNIPTEKVIARTGSEVLKTLGIPDLKFENTQNASAGLTFSPDKNFSVSVEGYYIKVQNRIILAGPISQNDRLVGPGLQKLHIDEARFFTNSLSTSTAGADLTIKYGAELGAGKLNIAVGANYNTMAIDTIKTTERLEGKQASYLNRRERYFILSAAPPTKVNLTLDYTVDNLTFMARGNYFGKMELINNYFGQLDKTGKVYTEKDYVDIYKPVIQTDVSIAYKFDEYLSFAIGGSNILNVYPTMSKPNKTISGGAWDSVQMGNNGAFFFAKVFYNF
ncbi:TonB-dependent receptor domain-containing protein [Dyadobacter subterraneus]|uniref:TonB-dependent receptor n=1 Tax=Dyadobacter subterraneus TaxID=2773304 RepID=A0ABR9W6W1_9BACT|nr:TonB-dependent receptor [Dyadobacter subterraneus]MBE9461203.1 TonB-dependent receptor [Dyadobacter subterraneus]